MLTERFSRLFGRLLTRWSHYQDAPREPDRVTELAAARVSLDEVRLAIADERARIVETEVPRVEARRVAISESELSRLRVATIGLDSNS